MDAHLAQIAVISTAKLAVCIVNAVSGLMLFSGC